MEGNGIDKALEYSGEHSFTNAMFHKVVTATRASQSIPVGNVDYAGANVAHNATRSDDQAYCALLDLARWIGGDDISPRSDSEIERFEVAVDAVDTALERAEYALRIKKVSSATLASVNPSATRDFKPQSQFSDQIDNSWNLFIPRIRLKLFSIEALPDYEQMQLDFNDQVSRVSRFLGDFDPKIWLPHPYSSEIGALNRNLELKLHDEHVWKDVKKTKCQWVDSSTDLEELLVALRIQTEIAVDLEAHSLRSYSGFTCLMQISTREEDFLIDTLALRSELHILNEIFCDPSIVKVFHGADFDIKWLQRDFGIYVVNMFDTYQALQYLDGFPKKGLGHLLTKFCNISTDKKFQLADWRVRPLPVKMVLYARQDTHYLLYIYDRLWNQLVNSSHFQRQNGNDVNLLEQAFLSSDTISLSTYSKPCITKKKLQAICMKERIIAPERIRAIETVYVWRDFMARALDESPGYIISKAAMVRVIQADASTPGTIVSACKPPSSVIGKYSKELAELITSSRSGELRLSTIFKAVQAALKAPEVPKANVKDTAIFSSIFADDPDIYAGATLDTLFDIAGWTSKTEDCEKLKRHTSEQFEQSFFDAKDLFGTNPRLDNEVTNVEAAPRRRSSWGVPSSSTPKQSAVVSKIWDSFQEIDTDVHCIPNECDTESVHTPDMGPIDSPSTMENEIDIVSPEDSNIPKSIAEIYKMSNINKRKKEKKKPKASIEPMKSISDPKTTEKFLKGISWMGVDDTLNESDSGSRAKKAKHDFKAGVSKFGNITQKAKRELKFDPYGRELAPKKGNRKNRK